MAYSLQKKKKVELRKSLTGGKQDRRVWFKDDPVIVSIVERYLCLQYWANLLRYGQGGVFA